MNANKNFLNIKNDQFNPWDDVNGPSRTDSRGHAIFADPAYGIRAAMRSLQKKWLNGKRTIAELCADWAPSDDTLGSIPGGQQFNDPEEYASFVSMGCGIDTNEPIPNPIEHPKIWLNLLEGLRAAAHYETGEDCPWSIILHGFAYWWADFVESNAGRFAGKESHPLGSLHQQGGPP